MLKKLLGLLVVLGMMVAVVGCGEEKKPEKKEEKKKEEKKEEKKKDN